jgi:hypothetical protein
MPPRLNSRYMYSHGYKSDDVLILTTPEPFRFQPFSDNRIYIVNEGDTLFSLAGTFFKGYARPSGLWWVIADFQPQPIHDPTLALDKGSRLYIPSVRTLIEEVFSAERHDNQ